MSPPGEEAPDRPGVCHFSLDLAVTRSGQLYRVRVGGDKAVKWLDENFHLPRDCEVIDTLAMAIARKAMQDNFTMLVSFD